MAGEGKVIKPPIDNVASGRIIRPAKAFRNKMWFTGILTAVSIWLIVFGSFWAVLWFLNAGPIFEFVWNILNFWYIIITLIFLIPYLVIVPIYLKSIEYSVVTEEGSTSAEIYVKKGIINITRKHVPFRTITNISSRAGIFDRLFGIGAIEIETAGYSGATQSAEEKLEGITFYEELRDYILAEMRKYKAPNVLGTEDGQEFEEVVPRMDGTLDDEILITLREMRDLLRRIDDKLDRRNE